MHRPESPWRWPAATALALSAVLSFALLAPRDWLGFLLPDGRHLRQQQAPPRRWLVLQPPLDIASAPAAEPERREARDEPPPPAAWWDLAWNARIVAGAEADLTAPAARDDSVGVLLDLLGLPEDWSGGARPDSVLAARLLLLAREDALQLGELRPYLSALGRQEAYRDILSRAAAMYDEFLSLDIRVPD